MDAITKPWVVLVGGFLASGKTTLILAAARELERRGLRSAMVWNDQGNDLVDSHYAALSGTHSGEVTGGCFCCRLSQLIDAIHDLRAHAPDVIFAEPVGSCTDLSGDRTPSVAPIQRHVPPFAADGVGTSTLGPEDA